MKLTRIEQEVMAALKDMSHCIYFDENAAKIVTVIFLSNKPISMSQLVQKTAISKTNVFLKLKKIEEAGIVKKIKNPGTKEFFYYIDKDINRLVIDHMRKKYEEFMLTSQLKIEDILNKYKKTTLDNEEKLQLKILKNYYIENVKLLQRLRKLFAKLNK
ncbi:MAG: hypothetical protein N3D10_03365 [Candidatus Micrarchaeota archaeon]|nr:hypothetical protein [Candidatus Micrarchaeota archaeon]